MQAYIILNPLPGVRAEANPTLLGMLGKFFTSGTTYGISF